MSVRRISVKEIISRVKQIFPDIPDTYIMHILNDGMLELGKHHTKVEYDKISSIEDQMWYDISDVSGMDINSIFRVSYMDSGGDYVKVPRLLDNEIVIMDLT